MTSYAQQIKDRIDSQPIDTIFTTADFSDIADANTVRRNLNRLVEKGELRRILNGYYDRPRYSDFLEIYLSPSPEALAKCIARAHHWTIAPCGDKALNQLGLDTQVPAKYILVSDGPNRKYKIGSFQMEFRHRTSKEITGLSLITIMVIQALKTLGKDRVTEKKINILRHQIVPEDKEIILKEATNSTKWIYDVIKQVCEGGKQLA